jgi:hypothetical protein
LGNGVHGREDTGGGGGQGINFDGSGSCYKEGDAQNCAEKKEAGAGVFRTEESKEQAQDDEEGEGGGSVF